MSLLNVMEERDIQIRRPTDAASPASTRTSVSTESADDDSTSPWDVTVLTDRGEFVELDLDAEFAVVSTGTDRDD